MSAPAVAVRERPILFSGPMVRALLDGTKTQTRRVILPSPLYHSDQVGWVWDREGRGMVKPEGAYLDPPYGFTQSHWAALCPFGYPGERLWVRETWACPRQLGGSYQREKLKFGADRYNPAYDYSNVVWRPSIHMPRAFSRVTLELTGVRVERVQDITPSDAAAEGMTPSELPTGMGRDVDICDRYAALWDSLNARRGYGEEREA